MCRIKLGECYHDGVAYAIGYNNGFGTIELEDKIFTTFDTGIDGGVLGELNRINANFDRSRDLPKFVVALKPVHIITDIQNDDIAFDITYDESINNAKCDNYGLNNGEDSRKEPNNCREINDNQATINKMNPFDRARKVLS